MQNIGLSWLVYTITDSPFLTGLTGAVQFLPIMLFSLFAGTFIDRYPKKKILIVTQTIAMILALALAALVFSGQIKFWHILVLGFLLGCSNTVDMPTRQSYTIEIAGRENLMNAIALNSMMFNLARILGPAIGGLLLAYAGAGWCFLLNGLSFIAVIFQLTRIKATPLIRERDPNKKILNEIKDGLVYIKKETLLLKTLLMITVIGIFVFNFNVLIPVFTKNILQMDGKMYGFLMSSLGVGSLIGALIASLNSKKGPKLIVMLSSGAMISVFMILTGFSRVYYLTALFLALTGIFNIFFTTTANTTLQMNSSDEYRSRVMSVYALLFGGTTPFGNLFAGYISGRYDAAVAFILSGGLTLILIVLINLMIKSKAARISANTI
jgi:MFS family permease